MFSIPFPEITPKILAVKLSAKGEKSVRSKHPWIFSDSIEKINKEGASGDIAVIFSHTKNKPIGVGLYDPDSPIRIKMLHFGSGAKLNENFFRARIQSAFSIRTELLQSETNSYRLLFGENDGFPGLIADVYDKVLVVKVYSAIWLPYLKTVLEILLETSASDCCVVRLSRNLQQNDSVDIADGTMVYGTLENEVVPFVEHGVQFSANVIKGHKTGYFLDHRANRKRVGELSKDKTVLDVFSYAGGFSVHALVGGAYEVTSMDISRQALEVAKDNVQLNEINGMHHCIDGDAFVEMQKLIDQGRIFDIVVIDPPSFAKSAREISMAKKKYAELAALGHQLVAQNGWLILASCSSRVTAPEFFSVNAEALKASGRGFRLEHKTYHDSDHPISFPEGAYLKCGYYRFDS